MVKYKGILAVIGGFLIQLTLGTFYTFGNMSTYLTSYLHRRVDSNVDYSMAIWVNALAYVGQGSLMIVGGILERKFGARKACLVGCILFSGGTALTQVAIQKGFAGTALLYGLISGCGLGIAYVVPLVNGMKWYPERKGLVNGFIAGGYGMGALVFNQVQTAFLNPDNVSPDADGYFSDKDVLDRVPTVFLLLGGVYGAMEIIGILLMCEGPSPVVGKEYLALMKKTEQDEETAKSIDKNDLQIPGEDIPLNTKTEFNAKAELADEVVKTTIDQKPAKNPALGIGVRAMLRKKEFYILWTTFVLNAQYILFINTMYKAFGQTFIQDDKFLSIVGSAASACNAGGRLVWGQLQDRKPYKFVMMMLCFLLTFFMVTMITTPYGGRPMFAIWVIGIYFSFSGLFVLLPTATSQAFGPKNVGANYGVVFTAPAVSSLLGAQLVSIMQKSLGWLGSFCFISSLSALAFFITILFPRDPTTILARHIAQLKPASETKSEETQNGV